jgi:anthranilate synthase/aminodeoxychorismate synthase-like glutamine amidotransferase
MKTIILDNYDSFTYNIYQYIGELGGNPKVIRNDQITLHEIRANTYTHIIISPGPGHPANEKDFHICKDVILEMQGEVPILGICLGLQGMVHHLGGDVVHAPEIMHGKTSTVTHTGSMLFEGLPNTFEVMRYHSLVAKPDTLPKVFSVTSTTPDGVIMSIEHTSLPMYGIQFHPESIGTPDGKTMLGNFLKI